MSSNAFILPAPPQIPPCGLDKTVTRGPAAFKPKPPGESSDPAKSFSATLNAISERRHGTRPKAAAAEKPGLTSRDSDTDSPSSRTSSNTIDRPCDHAEPDEACRPKESASSLNRQQEVGLLPFYLMNFSVTHEGALAVEPPSGSTPQAGLSMLTDLVGHLLRQQGQVEGEQLGIGRFEQLQFSISPEETNRAFFERIAFGVVMKRDGEGMPGETVRLFDFRQVMLPSASTALDGALSGQPESAGINGNAVSNPLLQMLGITGAAGMITPDAGSTHGSIAAAGGEGAHLNAAILDKLLTASQPAQAEMSENAKTVAAGHDGRSSTWAAGDSSSDILLEARARQMSEISQPLKIQAGFKADVDQPANPNSANEGLTVKTPEEVFGNKSALPKSEILAVEALGSKINQIDGDSKDSGFLFSQDQLPQHLARLENSGQPSESAARSLMPQTLDQIVQKAALSLHNGQHEVHLHLKPDFLGHIRMQIISEGQQVAIKMVAELPFVKDMLENNLHQLKADLQAQGLDIDELEVSVAHDSHAERDVHQKAQAAKLQAGETGADSDDESSQETGQTQSRIDGPTADTAIDYFA